jgi:hypothetical protein
LDNAGEVDWVLERLTQQTEDQLVDKSEEGILTQVMQLAKRRAPLHQLAKEWLFQEKKSYALLQHALGAQLTPAAHLEALLAVLENQYELNVPPWLAKGVTWESPLLALEDTVSVTLASNEASRVAPLLLQALHLRLSRLSQRKPRQRAPLVEELDTCLAAALARATGDLPEVFSPLVSCEHLEAFLRVMRALPTARAEVFFAPCVKREVARAQKVWGPWPFGLRREVQRLASILETHPSLRMAHALLYAARLSGANSGAEASILLYQEKIVGLAESYQELLTLAPAALSFPQALTALEKF